MHLRRLDEAPCPSDIIAIAINGNDKEPHCGILYTTAGNVVRLCDMKFEHLLGVRTPPPRYFWIDVKLDPVESLQIAVFIEMIIEREQFRPLPYSFLYTPDGFDLTGQIRAGVGVTCATFIINILDHFQFKLVDLASWKRRPKQDAAFRQRIIEFAKLNGYRPLADRLRTETEMFRLKPWEVYASASHTRYPVRFCQAKKLARTLSKLLRKKP